MTAYVIARVNVTDPDTSTRTTRRSLRQRSRNMAANIWPVAVLSNCLKARKKPAASLFSASLTWMRPVVSTVRRNTQLRKKEREGAADGQFIIVEGL